MNKLKISCIGKIKTSFWQDAATHYRERISRSLRLEEFEMKDADPALPLPQKIAQEGERLLLSLKPTDYLIAMDEKGSSFTSVDFASWLQKLWDQGHTPSFIIGGPYGLDEKILQKSRQLICLGSMTLPHELARVLLLEQIFRADSILRGTGYHH